MQKKTSCQSDFLNLRAAIRGKMAADMKIRTTFNIFSSAIAAAVLWASIPSEAGATTPQYQIYDIGVVDVGDTVSHWHLAHQKV